MTDKSKTETLSDADLDQVNGGFTATDDLANVKRQGKGWNIEQGSAWKVEEGESWTIEEDSAQRLKDAKDSGNGKR
ncbi:hypothetical protein A8B78_18420 [Jannaschia sp. EhC01]|nr:hypothetical protein A8B78_18420 [Jannaschia sp. EhC01]